MKLSKHTQTEASEKDVRASIELRQVHICESKHKDAVRITDNETDDCQASEPVQRLSRWKGVTGRWYFSVSKPFPVMPDKVIYPTCHWWHFLVHLLLLSGPFLSENGVYMTKSSISLLFHASHVISSEMISHRCGLRSCEGAKVPKSLEH